MLKLYKDLDQSFSEIFPSHLEIHSVNNIKQWSYTIFPWFSFRSWCTPVGIDCLLLSTEENFYSRYNRLPTPNPPLSRPRWMDDVHYINHNLVLSNCCHNQKYLNQDKFLIGIECRNYGLKYTHEIMHWNAV